MNIYENQLYQINLCYVRKAFFKEINKNLYINKMKIFHFKEKSFY